MLSMLETVNNAKIYGSAFINGPDHATDLDGNFVNRQAVQDAGINTILLAAPAITAELQALKNAHTLSSLFKNGRVPKASELIKYAEEQGWRAMKSNRGPLKFVDENGIERLVIKQGSTRAPGSNFPHVSLKNSTGQYINSAGETVSRNSVGNHSSIIYDLK